MGCYWIIGRGSPRRSVRPRQLLPRGASSRSPVPACRPATHPSGPAAHRPRISSSLISVAWAVGQGWKDASRGAAGPRARRRIASLVSGVDGGDFYGGNDGESGEVAIMGSDVSGASNSAQKWKAESPRSRYRPDPGRYTPSLSQSREEVATPTPRAWWMGVSRGLVGPALEG